jgi:hypothetical protein
MTRLLKLRPHPHPDGLCAATLRVCEAHVLRGHKMSLTKATRLVLKAAYGPNVGGRCDQGKLVKLR